MIRVEVVGKTVQAAEQMASALADEACIEVLRPVAMSAGYKPHANADVVVAVHVVPSPALPDGPPFVLLLHDGRVRRHSRVRAWLHPDASPAEIAAAALAASAGLYTLHEEQVSAARDLSPGTLVSEELTARELAVLRMMADGASNKEIGKNLGISTNTVKFHVAQVLAKLHVRSRTEAVRVGLRRGLVLL